MAGEIIGAVIMIGRGGHTPQEMLVAAAQRACTLDLIGALQRQGIDRIILATPCADWLPAGLTITVDRDPPGGFVFGRRLAEVIQRHALSRVLYFGGGSTPLLDGPVLSQIIAMLDRPPAATANTPDRIVLTNNLHSSDWLALTGAQDALPIIRRAERDNSLAWLLNHSGTYDVHVLARKRPAAGMDLDTPADLAIIARHPGIQPHLAAAVRHPLLDSLPVQQIARIAATPESHLTLIGRVSPQAWQALNRATQCWVRVFAEERGMVASGRLARGEVRSLIGELIRLQGPQTFFKTLASMTQAAIIDSRPLMAACSHWPDDADRFASDLFLVDSIKDGWLRDFTAAAREAPIPVLLGGHGVVAGSLYALAEIIERAG
ncbi:MAG: hypothetical protein HPY64_13780 [Anaerolineae bacterium]|nr:hypothetical protein [Anaerolineae bacterium]